MPVKSEDLRASCTIKISRYVRDHIESKADLVEPADRTLRRLFGLKLQKGEFPKKKKGDAPLRKNTVPWTTIKITVPLRDYITSKASWNESVDHTIRRLLKLEPLDK